MSEPAPHRADRADLGKDPSQVSGMFDEVAPAYDRTNAVLSVGNDALWRIATTRAVAPRPGERILDLAAGTGTSSVALARSGADVVAADFSPGMIAEGRRRHGDVPNVTFVEADATALPFADAEFDAATISFGLRNVNDPMAALAEMVRVLRPGGRVVICEFSTPPRALMRFGYGAYLKRLLPGIARLSSSNPAAYRYLAESIEAWPDQQVLSQWLRGVGFGMVQYRNLTAGVVALHRGRKPAAGSVRESVARRAKARREHQHTGEQPAAPRPAEGSDSPSGDA
jgi:demethylmenaquinone methyltransferase / 2-methoxy-6-polyprenyl-1,4-benzoquinol methylase